MSKRMSEHERLIDLFSSPLVAVAEERLKIAQAIVRQRVRENGGEPRKRKANKRSGLAALGKPLEPVIEGVPVND